jgi:cytochrome c oxidase subunit 2
MRKRPFLQMFVVWAIGVAIMLPIALVIPWFPDKGSIQAGNVRTLYTVLLIATVPIFVLVMTVVLYSVWQYRMRPGDEQKDGPPIHGNTRLEVVWTVLPAVLILGLVTYAYTVLHKDEKRKPDEMLVNVTARQFTFEFSYPGLDGKTIVSPQLYLPNDRPVVFHIRSLDVVHSFFVPEFSEKIDAVPGITTTLRVTPRRLGTYPAECTELCGAGHSLMRETVHVVSQSAFDSWAKSQKANAPSPVGAPPPGPASNYAAPAARGGTSSTTTTSTTSSSSSATSAAAGKAVFTGSSGCAGCHTLAAAGATGTVGPDLDKRLRPDCADAQSKQIRGATLQKCIDTAITSPYKYLPSGYHAGIMPSNFSQTLTSTQIQALVSFLTSATK